jgi:hypothetical protein
MKLSFALNLHRDRSGSKAFTLAEMMFSIALITLVAPLFTGVYLCYVQVAEGLANRTRTSLKVEALSMRLCDHVRAAQSIESASPAGFTLRTVDGTATVWYDSKARKLLFKEGSLTTCLTSDCMFFSCEYSDGGYETNKLQFRTKESGNELKAVRVTIGFSPLRSPATNTFQLPILFCRN